MIVREWLQQARERLSGFPSPDVDARLLLEHLMGRPLDPSALVNIEAAEPLLQRRLSHEPVQYITGQAPFRYLVLHVGHGVLIPRPETEILVDLAKEIISQGASKVVDLGAGSGAIAISIATETSASVTAVEKSNEAFAWLTRNVHQYAPDVKCVHADVAEVELLDVDLVVANPPYLPDAQPLDLEVVDFEPHEALFGGEDGSAMPELFMRSAASMLRSGGYFLMEHAEGHQEKIVELATRYFVDVERHTDLVGRPRFISARLS